MPDDYNNGKAAISDDGKEVDVTATGSGQSEINDKQIFFRNSKDCKAYSEPLEKEWREKQKQQDNLIKKYQ